MPEKGAPTEQISVILATYNRARLLRPALESILRQARVPDEVIVVDDGSTDDTPAVVQDLINETAAPIRYLWQANRGQPAALNHGLRAARGGVIAFLDSDDLWPADRLPAQLAFFHREGPSDAQPVGIVLGRKERFADGVTVNPSELAAANRRPVHYSLGAALVARWVFDRVGLFDEEIGYSADWDWFMRALELGIVMAADPRVTVLGRIHGSNITSDRAVGIRQTAHLVKRHLDRQRAQDAATPQAPDDA